jgi:F-type H+-transporting ATPase subunit b
MLIRLCAIAALVTLCAFEPAFAAKAREVSEWRHTWDLVWKIVNFLILAGLIYKFGKQPIIDFLNGQRNLVSMDLDELNKLKKQALLEQKNLRRKIDCMAQEIIQFEDRMSQAASKERDAILDQARRESDLIIERAELWAEQALKQAKSRLAGEILDEAEKLAAEKLKQIISDEDERRMFNDFNEQVAQSQVG